MERVINTNPHHRAAPAYVMFKDKGQTFLFTPFEVKVAHDRAKANSSDIELHEIITRKRGLLYRLLVRLGLK